MLTAHLCTWALVPFIGLLWPQDSASTSATQLAGSADFVREMRYLDSNHDRQIDADELAAGQQRASMLLMLSWEDCDQDGDGAVSPSELESAAGAAMQSLLVLESQSDAASEEQLANALSLGVLLDQLAQDEANAEELAALRAAVEDLDDEEAVVTHIVQNPKLYPKLSPVVTTYVHRYPVRPALRRHFGLRHPLPPHHRVKPKLHPGPKAVRKAPGAKSHTKPVKTKGPAKSGAHKPKPGPKGKRKGHP